MVQFETQSTGFGYQRAQRVGVVGSLKQKRGKKVIKGITESVEILGTEKWRYINVFFLKKSLVLCTDIEQAREHNHCRTNLQVRPSPPIFPQEPAR